MTNYSPVIRSQADLQEVWRHLMGPYSFGHMSVWWMLIEADGHPIQQLSEITETDAAPDEQLVASFAGLLAQLTDELGLPDARVAFLISRPGRDLPHARDRAWATALYDVVRRAGLTCEVVHLANDGGVVPLPLDALGAA